MINIWMDVLMVIGISAVVIGGTRSIKSGCRSYLRRRMFCVE